jgi:hypothetical protein
MFTLMLLFAKRGGFKHIPHCCVVKLRGAVLASSVRRTAPLAKFRDDDRLCCRVKNCEHVIFKPVRTLCQVTRLVVAHICVSQWRNAQ